MSGNTSTDTIDTGVFTYIRRINFLENRGYVHFRKNNKTGHKVRISKKVFDSEIGEAWGDYKEKQARRKIRVELITQMNFENAEPDRRPPAIVFDHVKKIVMGDGQLRIGYTQVEKEGLQQIKLPVEKLHKITIEFY